MTLEQLRIFIAVAEKQHVTRAACELNLTQSATSAAIAALETRYGIKLFDRVGRGIMLTQTGRDFLNEARAVVARAKAAAQVLDDLAGLKRGSLSLAASNTVANYWLPQRIDTFRKAIRVSNCALRSPTPSRSPKPSIRELPNLALSRARWTILRWLSGKSKATHWLSWLDPAIPGWERLAS